MQFNPNTIWLVVLLLSVLVVVHEFGHFISARFFKVKVYEFSVGFGPLIGKFVKNGIQYSFRWFLLGGFVKIAGMDMELEGGAKGEPVALEESFHYLPLWKKCVVIAAGPIFNVILGMILVFLLFAFVGYPSQLKNDYPVVLQASPGSPAFEAGIRPGDRIVSINGARVEKWTDIPEMVQKFAPKPLTVRILRKDQPIEKKITPMYNPIDKRYQMGIQPYALLKKLPPGKSFMTAVTYPWEFSKQMVKVLALMATRKIKGGLMGPIGMVTVVGQSMALPFEYFLSDMLFLSVNISLFLFLFNMLPLPLPILDGGWIVIFLLEKMMGREFTEQQKAAAQMIGMVAILALGAWIAYRDILNAIHFYGG